MKIYGHFFSAPANQVRLTASALDLPHEYVHVDLLQGEQRTPEFLAINRFGRVPALDDDGFRLSESGAISRYLASKADSVLYPSNDAGKRAHIDQWMDYAGHHVRANMAKVLFNKMFAPMLELEPDEKSLAEGIANLDACLPIVDAALGDTNFIAGDAMTIADTAMLAAMEPFEVLDYDISAHDNVKCWRETAMQQDWYQRVHAHYGAERDA